MAFFKSGVFPALVLFSWLCLLCPFLLFPQVLWVWYSSDFVLTWVVIWVLFLPVVHVTILSYLPMSSSSFLSSRDQPDIHTIDANIQTKPPTSPCRHHFSFGFSYFLKKNHLVMKTRSCDVHMRLYPLNLALVGGPDCLPPEELTPLSPLSSRPSCREWAELDCSCLKQHPDWHGASSLLFSVLSFHLMDLSSLNLHPLSWHAGSSISCADLNICSHPFLSTTTLVFQTTHMFSHILWLALPAFSALGSQGKCQRMSRDVPAMCYFCKWEPWVLSQGVCILVGGSCIYNYCSLWYPVLEI